MIFKRGNFLSLRGDSKTGLGRTTRCIELTHQKILILLFRSLGIQLLGKHLEMAGHSMVTLGLETAVNIQVSWDIAFFKLEELYLEGGLILGISR